MKKGNPNLTEYLSKGFLSGGQSGTFISMNQTHSSMMEKVGYEIGINAKKKTNVDHDWKRSPFDI
jgi:hypothetical protein